MFGASDAIASEVKDNPVTVEDFIATVYERLGIDLMLGRTVDKLEPQHKQIRLEGGQVIPYDRILIATGGRNRRLRVPGADREAIPE